jgi:hypothetical protein
VHEDLSFAFCLRSPHKREISALTVPPLGDLQFGVNGSGMNPGTTGRRPGHDPGGQVRTQGMTSLVIWVVI